MKMISAAEANRQFSRVMREVEGGETYIVTSRGKPCIRMEAVRVDDADAARKDAARRDLLEHLRTVKPLNLGKFSRDELYND